MYQKIKETATTEIWIYDTAIERNEHANSYGQLLDITRIYGDGILTPLTIEYKKGDK